MQIQLKRPWESVQLLSGLKTQRARPPKSCAVQTRRLSRPSLAPTAPTTTNRRVGLEYTTAGLKRAPTAAACRRDSQLNETWGSQHSSLLAHAAGVPLP